MASISGISGSTGVNAYTSSATHYTITSASASKSGKMLTVTLNLTITLGSSSNLSASSNNIRYVYLRTNCTQNGSLGNPDGSVTGGVTFDKVLIKGSNDAWVSNGIYNYTCEFKKEVGYDGGTFSNCAIFINDANNVVGTPDGTESCYWNGKSQYAGQNERYCSDLFTITHEDIYTKCKAPTNVTSNLSIQSLNGWVRIRWSGASGGTNNSINGYKVYYRTGAAPVSSSKYVLVGSNVSHCDIQLTAARGSTYYFKVMTVGSVSEYSSSLSVASATCKVNNLPSTPSVSLNYTKVPHNGGTVKPITLTATDSDGQVLSYYYATSSNGSKIKITAGGSISISQDTTLYFWSYDGLEYSESAKTINIIVATKPTISTITVTPDESSPEYGSDVKYRKNYVINVPSNDNYNYKYYCRRSQLDTSQSITPNNENKINIYDLINIKDTGNTSIEIGVQPSENIGYSTTNNGDITWSDPINLQSIPTPDHFDQFANNNLLAGYINKELRIKSSNNDGLTKLIVEHDNIELNAVQGSNFEQGFDYYITPIQGESMDFEITIYRDKQYKTFTSTRIAISKLDFTNVEYGSTLTENIKPFSQNNDSSTFYVYMTNILENEQNLSQYGLSNENKNPKLQLNSYQYDFTAKSSVVGINSVIGFEIPINFYFTNYQTQSLGITNFDKSYDFKINFVYINAYGEEQTFESDKTLTLDFVEPLKFNGNITISGLIQEYKLYEDISGFEENKKYYILNDNGDYEEATEYQEGIDYYYLNDAFLKQNETIIFNIPYKTYNTLPITPSIIINGMTITGAIITPTRTNGSDISDGITDNWIVEYKQNSPITSTNDISYTVQLDNTVKPLLSTSANLKVIKHTTTNFINLRITYGTDLTVFFDKFTSTSFGLWSGQNNTYQTGFSGELSIELSTDQNFSNNIQSYTLSSDYTTILEDNEYTNIISTSNGDLTWDENVPFYYVRLKLITTDNNGISKEVTSESPVTVIYNIQPTISYRPNHLGINYKNIDDTNDSEIANAILVIGETSDRNKIIYKGSGACTLVGFLIDGGDHDNW